MLPVSAFDSVFVLWIFNSLSRTLTQLVLRKQTHKLRLYRVYKRLGPPCGVHQMARVRDVVQEHGDD